MFIAARISHTRKLKPFLRLPLSYFHGVHASKPFSSFSSSSSPSPTLETLLKDEQSPLEFNYAEMKERQSPFQLKTVSNNAQIQNFSREGNFNEIVCETKEICMGCGVHMQNIDSKQPGYYILPSVKTTVKVSRQYPIEEYDASNLFKKGFLNELMLAAPLPKPKNKPIVCARCHSIRSYGKAHDDMVEKRLPEFNFYNTVGRKLATASGVRSVVLMVVDAVDFDGSFPKMIADLVSETIEKCSLDWKDGKSGNVPRLVLVLTKVDLLPTNVSPTRLEHWVRQRARESGAIQLAGLHMVSALRGWGVGYLIEDVVRLVGPKGNVWAVGAQNAGKSTLINAMLRCVREKEKEEEKEEEEATETERPKRTKAEKKKRKKMGTGELACLTEAPVPGTTLGIVRVEGILPGKAKLFDTPGLYNPHHIVNRLTMHERKLVLIRKELKPRTYRVNAGRTVHIGGLLRLDIEELSVDTLYITVWASPLMPLHMSKTENVDKMQSEFFGRQLQPPIGKDRIKELGNWARREFHVGGTSWQENAVDIAAAGVGWFSLCLNGEAIVGVWTYDGIEVTVRKPLLPQRASRLEIAGFNASRIVREADAARNSVKPEKKASRRKSKTWCQLN